jgi:ceramide glucosyltransferase
VTNHSEKPGSLTQSNISDQDGKGENKYAEKFFPPVSILKPLQGADPGLQVNLSSFCELDYPEYELIFCLEKGEDKSLSLIRELQEEYPKLSIKIAQDDNHYGYNPKVNNLIRGLKHASYDLILISDADVCPARTYLKDTARYFVDPGVGLVTNLIRGKGKGSLGAILENLYLNSFVLGGTCSLYYYYDYTCVTGKSVLFKKGDLEKIGSFSSLKNFLAEDQILGKKFRRLGKKVILSNHLITSNNSKRALTKFFSRNLRWSQMRMQLGGLGYISEMMVNPVFIATVFVILSSFSTFSFSAFLGTSFYKIIVDSLEGKMIQARAGFFPYFLTPLKDILIGIIWFSPFFKTSVEWRGTRFKLKRYTELEPIETFR